MAKTTFGKYLFDIYFELMKYNAASHQVAIQMFWGSSHVGHLQTDDDTDASSYKQVAGEQIRAFGHIECLLLAVVAAKISEWILR